MPQLNMADEHVEEGIGKIIDFNNLQLTPEECKEVIDFLTYVNEQPIKIPESVQKLVQLIETAYNLGMAYIDDTNGDVDIFIAADYRPIDIDDLKDTDPDTDIPQTEPTSSDIEKDAN